MHATIFVLTDCPEALPEDWADSGVVPYAFDYVRLKPGSLTELLREIGRLPDPQALARRLARLGIIPEEDVQALAESFIQAGENSEGKDPVAVGAALPVEALGDSREEAARGLLEIIRQGLKTRREEIDHFLQGMQGVMSPETLLGLEFPLLWQTKRALELILGYLVPEVGFYDDTGRLDNDLRDLERLTPGDLEELMRECEKASEELWVAAVDVHV